MLAKREHEQLQKPCVCLVSMYTEKSARLQNQVLTMVPSGGYDGEDKKTFHLLYRIHLSVEFSEPGYVNFSKKGKKVIF